MNKVFLPLLSFIVFVCVLIVLNPGVLPTHAQSTTTVTFGAVGDMGGSSNASAVLTGVKNANLNFFLHVGDFSYDQQGGPSGWPGWVKGIVGTVLPYEIVSGNHDDCCISSYVAGLPNKMANLNGTYGENYYFDYPQTSPLMRVIMISPGGFSVDTTWLSNAIDAARSAKIPWVVVGMHRNCITTGQKSCEIGQSLTDLLMSKKVDLILQGHDHNYQRSKQLTCAKANSFSASCVANAGPNFTKGAGSVIVLNGAGGNGFYSVSSSDSEAGYFATMNSDTYGFSQFTVTANQISEKFVRGAGGNLTDSFTIAGPSSTNPSPTPTVPVTNPSPSGVIPTFGCVSNTPCTPSATPTTRPNATPSTNPGASAAPSAQPTVDPCANGGASVQDEVAQRHHKKHKHSKSGNNGGLSRLIQMLLDWLKKLFEMLGIPWPDNLPVPGLTPTPSQTPGDQPTAGPTVNPCPSATTDPSLPTATTAPSVAPTSGPTSGVLTPTTPVGGNTTCTNPIGSTSEATGTISIPGSSIVVRNEAWNGSHGPQTIYACSEQSWYVQSNQPNNGGAVETYPDSLYSISGSKNIPQYTSITSTFGEAYQPLNDWNAGYDIWLNNWTKEVMIWNEWNGGPGYWPTQATTAVSLGGVPYHFYDNGGELMFFRDTQVKSGSVDILAALKWLVTQNKLSSSDVPTQIEYGVEISGTGGTTQRFDTTGFTVSIQ